MKAYHLYNNNNDNKFKWALCLFYFRGSNSDVSIGNSVGDDIGGNGTIFLCYLLGICLPMIMPFVLLSCDGDKGHHQMQLVEGFLQRLVHHNQHNQKG